MSVHEGLSRQDLLQAIDDLLQPGRFKDYCPNGLQVEGRARISRVLCAVTATQRAVDEAARRGVDALLVHHGWFWRGDAPNVRGMLHRRLKALMHADINLIAYHLPLDAHPELGNNVCLARLMGWPIGGRTGEQELVFWGDLEHAVSATELGASIEQRLGRTPLLVGAGGETWPESRTIRRVAWCTGGAQDFIEAAHAAGADAFVSGEISERTTHIARELGIVYVSAGHHATERGGVQALGDWIARRFASAGVQISFFDDPNPV